MVGPRPASCQNRRRRRLRQNRTASFAPAFGSDFVDRTDCTGSDRGKLLRCDNLQRIRILSAENRPFDANMRLPRALVKAMVAQAPLCRSPGELRLWMAGGNAS
jgi:hypothetical protein